MASGPAGYKNDEACAVQAQMHIIDDCYMFSRYFNICSIFVMLGQFNSRISTNLSRTMIVLSEHCSLKLCIHG